MVKHLMVLLVACLAFQCKPSDAETNIPKKIPATKNGPREVAMVGAGCFWGVEAWMEKAPGVSDIVVGYAGGASSDVKYEDVAGGDTGHAETVKITFDPTVISYEDLLANWFFKIHDPTTKNRQGNDQGTQYRSVIFPMNDAQKAIAMKVKARVEKSGQWKAPITTTIEMKAKFVTAEDYHQDYLVHNPGGYDNHYMRKLTW